MTRGVQKERTRRAFLDAALTLSQDGGLGALSLRQVAREVGLVPTAFYRHFSSIEEMGLTLVQESFDSLRGMLRDVRRENQEPAEVIAVSVEVLGRHVREHREHFGFIARERRAGSPVVRDAVRHQIELVERELATDLARLTPPTWSATDLAVLANLIVVVMVNAVEDLLQADRPELAEAVLDRTRTQITMLAVGAQDWRSRA
ncbi:MAG: TetR family transcriptional regulator [Marmoricola sp.]